MKLSEVKLSLQHKRKHSLWKLGYLNLCLDLTTGIDIREVVAFVQRR